MRRAREVCLILAVAFAGAAPAAADLPPEFADRFTPQNRVVRDGSIGGACSGTECILGDDLGIFRWTIPALPEAYSESGDNLFHSFEFFDVDENYTALFTRTDSDPQPRNLIVRVTGMDRSEIAGALDLLGSNPAAEFFPDTNLFLLNPYGISFTPTSSLRLDGSLYASTADLLRFPDRDFPSGSPIVTPQAELSGLDPAAFGFLSAVPESIVFDRDGGDPIGTFSTGDTFALIGGDVTVRGSGSGFAVTLEAQGATVALASVAQGGVDTPVLVDVDVAKFDARSRAPDQLGDIRLENDVIVRVQGESQDAGRFVIRGGRFVMQDGSVTADNEDGDAATDENGMILPAIDIEVAGRTENGSVEGVLIEQGARLQSISQGDSPSGPIEIYGPQVTIRGGSTRIRTEAVRSDGADITIEGSDIAIEGEVGDEVEIWSRNRSTGAPFVGGTIRIGDAKTSSIRIGPDSLIQSLSIRDLGTGGDVTLQADAIRVQGGTIDSQTQGDAIGGEITLQGGSILVSDQGQILSSMRDRGRTDAATGGNITISGTRLEVSGARIESQADGFARGGAVNVTVDEVEVSELGRIASIVQSTADASAQGGDVSIQAAQVTVRGLDTDLEAASQISAITDTGSAGGGGNLTVAAQEVLLIDGGQLRTTTRGSGHAGALVLRGLDPDRPLESVRATGQAMAMVDGEPRTANSGVFALTTGAGDAGSILVDARLVEVSNGGTISASSESLGRSGNVTIPDADRVVVRGGAGRLTEISAQTAGAGCTNGCGGEPGDFGNIDITTDTLEVSEGGKITASTIARGDAGSVIVNARVVTVTGTDDTDPAHPDPSGIFAKALSSQPDAGDGGSILITVEERLTVSDGAQITAETQGDGDAGSVLIGSEEAPVGEIIVKGGKISTQTSDAGAGGDIELRAVRQIVLRDGAQVTAESSGSADAGSIFIDAGKQFLAVNNSPLPGEGVVSTKAEQAAGGIIQIRATELVYLSDSRIETQVEESGGDDDGGDFGTPRLFGSTDAIAPAELVVLNRSRIVASAVNGDGGNILIDGTFLPSEALLDNEDFAGAGDSVLDASSETGTPGQVVVTSPGSELAGQLVPLPSNYLDASKLLLAPCAARTARTGSFTVELQALEPPPDAPFAAGRAPEESPGSESTSCPSEETLR